jgi:hypothetical protein
VRLSRLFTLTRFLVVAITAVIALLATLLVTSPAPAIADAAGGAQFVSATGRIMDTRDGTGGYKTAMPANTWRTVQVTGLAGIPNSSAVTAVALNLTEVSPSGLGQVSARPNANTASTLVGTFDGGNLGITSNQADVAVNSDGTIQVMANASTQLVIDVEGYYSTSSTATGGYVPIAGKRYVGDQTIAAGGNFTIQITGVNGIPANATAIVADFIVKNQGTTQGYISPGPAAASPPVTSLNYPGVANVATATSAHVSLSSDGKLEVWNRVGSAIKLNIDVEGYFVQGSSTAGSFTAGAGRAYDTRVKPHVSVAAGKTLTVPLGGTHGIPATSDGLSSVVVDLTALHASNDTAGFARAWADGTAEPNISALEYAPDSIRSNTNTVPVGLDGAIEIHNISSTTVDFVVDIEGWYAGAASTMCTSDNDSINGDGDAAGTTAGAASGQPVLSAVLSNSLGNDLQGSIYVVDGNGTAIGGSPTAVGTVNSGTRLTYHLPATLLTQGQKYTWWVHAAQSDGCAAQATSARHTFVEGAVAATATPSTSTLTLPASAISAAAGVSTASTALQSGQFAVGSDGSNDHISSLKLDLSSVPAGAHIVAASLNMKPGACFGTSCNQGNLVFTKAHSDVTAAQTGADLAAIDTEPENTVGEASANGTYDITDLTQQWFTGNGENDGAILSEAGAPAGTTGEAFSGPNDPTSPATVTITYVAATAPTAPLAPTALAGDGGVVVSWGEPDSSGYADADAVMTYTVTVTTTAGKTAATKTITGDQATITGLTNGTSYTASVVAQTPAGSSPAATTSPVTPTAVTNGAATYVTSVQHLVDAEDALSAGTGASTADVTSGYSDAATILPALGTVATAYEGESDAADLASQTDTNDKSTLSNTLAVQNGTTVTVYTTVSEAFTTQDTSGDSEQDLAGGTTDDTGYRFNVDGTKTTYAGIVDERSTLQPVTTSSPDTAADAATAADIANNGDAPSVDYGQAQTASFTTAHMSINTGLATSRSFRVASSGVTGPKVNLSRVASDAVEEALDKDYNNFYPDCTDFVSRELWMGGERQVKASKGFVHIDTNKNSWYDDYMNTSYSQSWGLAPYNYRYMTSHGGVGVSASKVKIGEIAYGALYGGGTSAIDHAAIVSKVTRSNIYVAQHTSDYQYDPIYKVSGHHSWAGSYHKMQIYFVDPTNI